MLQQQHHQYNIPLKIVTYSVIILPILKMNPLYGFSYYSILTMMDYNRLWHQWFSNALLTGIYHRWALALSHIEISHLPIINHQLVCIFIYDNGISFSIWASYVEANWWTAQSTDSDYALQLSLWPKTIWFGYKNIITPSHVHLWILGRWLLVDYNTVTGSSTLLHCTRASLH